MNTRDINNVEEEEEKQKKQQQLNLKSSDQLGRSVEVALNQWNRATTLDTSCISFARKRTTESETGARKATKNGLEIQTGLERKAQNLSYFSGLRAASIPMDSMSVDEQGKAPSTPTNDDSDTVEQTCRPWNHQDFLARLTTFEIWKWFAKPQVIGAYDCARYGWSNIDVDKIQCARCKKVLCFHITDKLGMEVCVDGHQTSIVYYFNHSKSNVCLTLKATRKIALVYSQQLNSGHEKTCPWRDNPCSESFSNLPLESEYDTAKRFRQRCVKLLTVIKANLTIVDIDDSCFDQLTEVMNCTKESCLKILESFYQWSMDHEISVLESVNKDVAAVVSILALSGWTLFNESNLPDKNGVIWCDYCNRKLGVWNFSGESIQPNTQKKETDKKYQSEKSKLNPITEHRWYCPWQVESFANSSAEECSRVFWYENLSGWKRCSKAMFSIVDIDQSLQNSVQLTDKTGNKMTPLEAFKTVRQILDLSSSSQ